MEDKCPKHAISNCSECIVAEINPNNGNSPEIEDEPKNEPQEPQVIDSDSEEDKPAEAPEPEDEAEKNPKSRNSFEMTDSKVGHLYAIQSKFRDLNIKYGQYDSKILLFEESVPISLEDCDDLDNGFSDLVPVLKKERLLLLGDTGDQQGLTIAYQIAKSLEIYKKEENVRVFYLYNDTSEKHCYIDSFEFKREKIGDEEILEAVVIIEARGAKSEFADSLVKIGVPFAKSHILPGCLYLICVVESSHIKGWKGHLDKRNFPYRIIDNRKEEEIRHESELGISQNAEKLLSSESEVDGPIAKTVLFVASFFPNLTTRDFNDLVSKWLQNEPDITRPTAIQNNPEETVFTKVSLGKIWELKSHIFTERCFLSQTKTEQGKRIINFEDESYAKYVKDRFESKYFIFLDKKVSDILDFGLIFHPSDDISSHSIVILVEYIREIGEKLTEWLLEIFRFLEKVENLDELRRYLKVEEISEKHFYYDRLAKLFRALLPNPSLEVNVDRILDRLIRSSFYKSVLILVKRLYYAPNFDGLRWLKQLTDRGDPATRSQALGYLFVNLSNQSIGNVFESLKLWLPDEETPVEKYSLSNKAVLTLLIDYYSYQTEVFDEQLYGAEPCQFPLFVFDEKSSAENQLELIVKYLLHPSNFILLSDELPYIYVVAYLLERWAAILHRKSAASEVIFKGKEIAESGSSDKNEALNDKESLDGRFTNKEILNSLLEQVILHSDKNKQDEILSVWEEFMEELSVLIDDLSTNWKVRENASKRRKTVRNLIESFKKSKRLKR